MHLFAGPFVQGCHYAGCDQATKFSSKINRPPPLPYHPLLSLYPQGDAPPGRVSSLFHCTPSLAKDLLPVYSLFNTTPFVSSFFLVYPACALLFLITLTHFFSSSSSASPLFPYFYFGMPLYSHLILFPPLSFIFNLSISSLIFFPPSISLSVWPRPRSLETGPSRPCPRGPPHGPVGNGHCVFPLIPDGAILCLGGMSGAQSKPAGDIVSHSK